MFDSLWRHLWTHLGSRFLSTPTFYAKACEAAIAKVESQTQTASEKERHVTLIRIALARALSASGRHQEGLEIARKANDWLTEFGDPESPEAKQAQDSVPQEKAERLARLPSSSHIHDGKRAASHEVRLLLACLLAR